MWTSFTWGRWREPGVRAMRQKETLVVAEGKKGKTHGNRKCGVGGSWRPLKYLCTNRQTLSIWFCRPRLHPVKIGGLFAYMMFVCCHTWGNVPLYLHFRKCSVEEFPAYARKSSSIHVYITNVGFDVCQTYVFQASTTLTTMPKHYTIKINDTSTTPGWTSTALDIKMVWRFQVHWNALFDNEGLRNKSILERNIVGSLCCVNGTENTTQSSSATEVG